MEPEMKSTHQENRTLSSSQNLLVPISIVIAGALIATGIYFSGGKVSAPTNQKTPDEETADASNISREELLKGAMVIGDPNAPVVLAEFADFQCPYCGKFTKETRPAIIDQYVKTGKVLLVYHDFAFLGQESVTAAEAARCANDQGKFWDYHNYLYNYLWDNYYTKNKSGENVGAFSNDNLKKFAVDLKLDIKTFSSCLDTSAHNQAVIDSTALGRKAGISGTPGFIINGKVMTGALPFSDFQKVIEAALKK